LGVVDIYCIGWQTLGIAAVNNNGSPNHGGRDANVIFGALSCGPGRVLALVTHPCKMAIDATAVIVVVALLRAQVDTVVVIASDGRGLEGAVRPIGSRGKVVQDE
jgi:hypothetical protein